MSAHLYQPLEGMKLIAVEHYGSGPYGSMYFADFGAEVIKIENRSEGGDFSRSTGPFFLGEKDSEFFQTLNRNKKSITLDLKSGAGRTILHRLVAGADAVTNNLRGDQPAKLGLTYDALKAVNPKIVCGHISGYGRDNSRETWPAFDYLMQAEAGWMMLTGAPDDPPTRAGVSVVDFKTGVTLAFGVLAGIVGARRTGKGCDIDAALFDVCLHTTTYPNTFYLNHGYDIGRKDRSSHPILCPSQLVRASDRWLFIMVITEKFWKVLIDGIGRPDLAADPRFADFPARLANRAALTDVLDIEFSRKTAQEWIDQFAGTLPVALVRGLGEALDAQFPRERALIAMIDHPQHPGLRVVANPLLVDGERMPVRSAPALGAHTEEVLTALGFSTAEIVALRKSNVI